MKRLSLTTKQRTRTADVLEKAAIAALIAILGAEEPSVWLQIGGGSVVLLLAGIAVRVERAPGRRH